MAENLARPTLRTDRSWVKMIFLGILTGSIYDLVVITRVAKEMNLLAQDGKKTMHYCLVVFVFTALTLGIVPLVWWHRLCNRMGDELRRRGLNYEFSAGTFWGWCVFGTLLFGIGPIIFYHKFCTASNMLNADFNTKG